MNDLSTLALFAAAFVCLLSWGKLRIAHRRALRLLDELANARALVIDLEIENAELKGARS